MDKNSHSQQVLEIIDRLATEGMHVNSADVAMLNAYASGAVTGHDMLAHALQFTTEIAYKASLYQHQDSAIDKATTDAPIEQVLREFRAGMQRRRAAVAEAQALNLVLKSGDGDEV